MPCRPHRPRGRPTTFFGRRPIPNPPPSFRPPPPPTPPRPTPPPRRGPPERGGVAGLPGQPVDRLRLRRFPPAHEDDVASRRYGKDRRLSAAVPVRDRFHLQRIGKDRPPEPHPLPQHV